MAQTCPIRRLMNHPEHILRTLDHHLKHPTRVILYGRAALALGYPDAPPTFQTTMDVDAILPEIEMHTIEADESFWNALELTNQDLEPSGLYITHLFTDAQVILRPHWLSLIVPVHLGELRQLALFRPSTEDLILTKMMRVDPQDRDDIQFLLSQTNLTSATLQPLLSHAMIPPIDEIQQAFQSNATWLQSIISPA
jgi:serine/threonine protein kinase